MEFSVFTARLEEITELEAGTLKRDSVFEELTEISSLVTIGLISFIDEEFDIHLPFETIMEIRTVEDLIQAIGPEHVT